MTPDAFYEAFLAILQVHGFVAVPAGNVIKIIPDANARQVPGDDLPERVSSSSDEIVTQVIAVKNVSAAQLVPILRPLIPQYGHLAAYPGLEHADHFGSRQQREPHGAHHPPHRSGGRRGNRRHPAASMRPPPRWCGWSTRSIRQRRPPKAAPACEAGGR